MAPPGRQKSEREFCLFGGVFLRPVCRAIWQAGRSCAASRCCAGLCDRCPGVCSLLHLAAGREACCNRVRLLRRCFPAHTPPAAFVPGLRCPRGLLSFVRCAQKAQVFLLLFHAQPTERSSFFCRCSAALFPACVPLFCRLYADTFVPVCLACAACPPCALCAQFRLVSAVCLPVPCWLHARFSLIFYLLPFPVWLLPLKLLFICRSGRDGDFLACPLPWLCSRPEGLVTCCFFTDFCARCLFASSALFMRVFSLLFFCPFLPNFFLSNFFSFVAQAATGLYFLPKRK